MWQSDIDPASMMGCCRGCCLVEKARRQDGFDFDRFGKDVVLFV
jgi:NADH:ubiquinone oxidoreductase subunit B-like Fe-S oxidoreductase